MAGMEAQQRAANAVRGQEAAALAAMQRAKADAERSKLEGDRKRALGACLGKANLGLAQTEANIKTTLSSEIRICHGNSDGFSGTVALSTPYGVVGGEVNYNPDVKTQQCVQERAAEDDADIATAKLRLATETKTCHKFFGY